MFSLRNKEIEFYLHPLFWGSGSDEWFLAHIALSPYAILGLFDHDMTYRYMLAFTPILEIALMLVIAAWRVNYKTLIGYDHAIMHWLSLIMRQSSPPHAN